jgi:hypothetical protein
VDTPQSDGPVLESVKDLHSDPTVHYLSREDILSAQDYQTEVVEVPAWGGSVIVQSLTGKQRDAFEMSQMVQKGKSVELNLINLRAKLVALSLVDQDHNLLFTEADVIKLGQKNAAALESVYKVAQKLSGLNREDIEELTIALKGVQSDDSGSD